MPVGERDLKELDKRYIWHPFTQMREWLEGEPIVIERGEGNYLFDTEGRRYLDGVSSIWCNIHGHRRKEIDSALREQLERVAHSTLLGLSNIPSIELAERLVSIAPEGLTKVFYSDNGSTAVEVAIKMAFHYWRHKGQRRDRFVAFTASYHGDTIGSVSVGGIELFHGIYRPLLFPVYRAHYPYCYRCHLDKTYPGCGLACLEEVEGLLSCHHREVAAVIIEPLFQGASGMIVSPPGFLRGVRELCSRYGVLLIADEVATAFGRTGRMFACDHEGVRPDFLCLAKGLTGGYLPLAATLTTEEVFNAFLGDYSEFKTFFHGHTYTGNPLGCAAALANLRIFEEERVLERLGEKVEAFERALGSLKDLPHVGDVRHIGLVAGIELVRDRATKEPYPLEEKMGFKVCNIARQRGLLLRPLGNVIVLMPPLSITEKEVVWMVETVREAIEETTNRSPRSWR